MFDGEHNSEPETENVVATEFAALNAATVKG